MRKAVAIYGLVLGIVWLSVFVYDHPHKPVVFDGAQTCQAYRLDVPGRTNLVTQPFYEGSWIVGQPVTCSNGVMDSVVSLLRNPVIYGRPGDYFKCGFDAQYAYRLSGRTGSVIVRIDTDPAWFTVDSFDRSGKHISGTGLVEEHGRWLALLRQTFPRDARIAKASIEKTSW